RASELRGIAWTAVDLKNCTVRVEQRADAYGVIGAPKSVAGFRTIPLPGRAIATLREWKIACPAHSLNLVFPSQQGKVLSHGIMTKNHVMPILLAAGVVRSGSEVGTLVAKYSIHTFRHAAASLWIEQGLNPKRVQTLVGHGSIQVTFDTYGHLFEQLQDHQTDGFAIERALFQDAT
ncbi:site-specific integrase, partial [Altererythrobacter sp. KTW20L]|uniref:site-specific integrase n=1 Tax=Altererythrobacter sp. KTW20L TaxID=2942210 RepID=UPI0020BE837A